MGARRSASILFVVAAIALGAPACDGGGDGDDDVMTTADAPDGATTTSTPSSTTEAAGSTPSEPPTLTMNDSSFDPSRMEVARGAVRIKLLNAGRSPHTFTVDDPKLDVEVAAGQTNEVLARLNDAGEVRFYCRFHRAQGMEGTITVTG